MSSIDERIVQMKFDNSQFQKGVADTNNSLASLKQGLNLSGAAAGLNELQAAGNKFSLAGIGEGVDVIASKFTNLGIMGVTALVNLTNQAVNAGINIAKSLTIAPIADGYADYGRKITSMQTIMNSTGASMKEVGGYFTQLDTYADKTIYNLDDMTGAFAKFTNAGVSMDKAVPAIKGIANMTALAGQDAGAASIAMYNLSQSIAGGFLTTTDYKSLNLANIATKEWKDQMIAGAVAAGKLDKVGDKYHIVGTKAGAASTAAELFNDDLKEGWASTEVMMKVLGDYGDTQTEIGKKAQASAQDVKSWGMMMETLSAGVGTGWTDTFETIFGDVTEAKALFTPLTNTIGGFLDMMSASRNDPLKEWKDLGGRTMLIETLQKAFMDLMKIVKPVKDAFVEIFPPVTGKNLMDITTAFRNFVLSLTPSPAIIDAVKRTARGLFALLDIGKMVIMGIVGVVGRLLGSVSGAGAGFLGITANVGDFILSIRNAMKYGTGLNSFFDGLGTAIGGAINGIKSAVKWIKDLFGGMQKVDTSGATAAIDNVTKRVDNLKEAGSGLKNIWKGFADVVKQVFDFFAPLGQKIADTAGKIGSGIADALKGVNFNTLLDSINTGLFAALILMIRKFLKGGKEEANGASFLTKIKEAIGGLTDTLSAMQTTLKAGTLILIAGAVALLAGAILILSTIDSGKLMSALAAIGALMGQLLFAMFILDKISGLGGAIKITILAGAMTLFAIAIGLLALSMKIMATMSWEEILKGLVGVVGLLLGIAAAMKIMSGVKGNLIGAGIGMMFIAVAIKLLASAVKDFADMDWQKMMQGLIAVGMVLGGLAIFTQIAKVNKGAVAQGAGLILLGIALKILASAVGDFASMDWQKMMQGLIALGMVLGGLAVFSRVVNPSQMVSMGISMVIVGASLKIIASAIQDMGNMDVKTLIKGLGSLALVLAAIAVFSRVVNPAQMVAMGVSMILIGASLKIIASAIKDMGGMSWEEIGRGMVVLAGSLAILAGAMYLMSFGVAGAAGMLIMAAALAVFVPILQSLGNMSWDQIGTGLGALAASLGIVAAAGIVLGVLSPLFALFGASLILIGIGAVLAGAGLLAFSIGFAALAVAGAAGAASLIAIISGLLGLIPMAFTQIGLGILAFAAVIANGAPAMVGAIVAVLTAIINAIITVIPLIVQVFVVLVVALVNAIVTLAPMFFDAMTVVILGLLNVIAELTPAVINTMIYLVTSLVNAIVGMIVFFVDAGMRLIIGIIDGIASRIGQVIDAGANLIVQFLNGIGRNIPKIIQAGVDLILEFVNGLADGIRRNTAAMNAAGGNLASAIIEGMTSGIRNGVNAVVNAAKDMAKSAFEAAKNFLQINSPSKIFRSLGASTGEGFVQGMDRYGNKVEASAAGMGSIALESLKDTMSGISAIASRDIDTNPVIRPVLDLTDIQNNAGRIGSMLKSPNLMVDGSYAKAASLVERERAALDARTNGSDGTDTTTGDQYVFNQTINSPKAVSAADAYRGTKNLISVAKDTKKGAPTK